MKRAGKSDRFIATVTDHKCLGTLKNYDPEPEMDERIDGANAIMGKKISITETVIKSKITKTVSRTSIHRESQENDRQVLSGPAPALHQIAETG